MENDVLKYRPRFDYVMPSFCNKMKDDIIKRANDRIPFFYCFREIDGLFRKIFVKLFNFFYILFCFLERWNSPVMIHGFGSRVVGGKCVV